MTASIILPAPADFHVHLRDGQMSELIAPHVEEGGVALAYIMPNLVPPITSTSQALSYQQRLKNIAPNTQYWMTLYLGPELTPEEIEKAARAGIKGVKSYPRGVTTNSDGGIENYEVYYPVFAKMEEVGMVLNLHGEVPSDADSNICVLNAEESFLKHLHKLHAQFPKLRIVLEHATTRAAVEAVKACGDTVACTITPHHLSLTVDDWAGKPLHFCKPVAKFPSDRLALQEVIKSGHPRFFLGSDSAPHPLSSKMPSAHTHGGAAGAAASACAAGVYTSAVLIPLCATLLESFGALDALEGYVSSHGRRFYNAPLLGSDKPLVLKRVAATDAARSIPFAYTHPAHQSQPDGNREKLTVVPFWAGKSLPWYIARN